MLLFVTNGTCKAKACAAIQKSFEPQDYVIVFGSSQSVKSVIENLTSLKTQKTILFYRSENSLHLHFREDDLTHIESLKMTPQQLIAQKPFMRLVLSGVIGLGIAFPEIMPYELGQIEYPVTTIWPVMKRLNKLMPQWLN